MILDTLTKILAVAVATLALAGCAGEIDDTSQESDDVTAGATADALKAGASCHESDSHQKFHFTVWGVYPEGYANVSVNGREDTDEKKWNESRIEWYAERKIKGKWESLNESGGIDPIPGRLRGVSNKTRSVENLNSAFKKKKLQPGDRIFFKIKFDDIGWDPECMTDWIGVRRSP